MKRAIRIAVLILGLVCTYIAAAVPQVPAADGGPLMCGVGGGPCKPLLPS
jgi:hypothetical protein